MKHFKIIGPETTREFDIEDDEMIEWYALKISNYYGPGVEGIKLQNEIFYPTEIKA